MISLVTNADNYGHNSFYICLATDESRVTADISVWDKGKQDYMIPLDLIKQFESAVEDMIAFNEAYSEKSDIIPPLNESRR